GARRHVDSARGRGAHCAQRALGRLLSAAREPAPTHTLVREQHEPSFRPRSSGLRAIRLNTVEANGRKGSMSRAITPATSVDNLRKDARRWLRALRAGDPAARARLERVRPDAPLHTVLRDVQHALALEHGQESWIALTRAVTPPDYQRLAQDLA